MKAKIVELWQTIHKCVWCRKPIRPNKAGLCPDCLLRAKGTRQSD